MYMNACKCFGVKRYFNLYLIIISSKQNLYYTKSRKIKTYLQISEGGNNNCEILSMSADTDVTFNQGTIKAISVCICIHIYILVIFYCIFFCYYFLPNNRFIIQIMPKLLNIYILKSLQWFPRKSYQDISFFSIAYFESLVASIKRHIHNESG